MLFHIVDLNTKDYFVGDPSIDKEHEGLIMVFNFFVHNIEKGSLASANNISFELKKHIFLHFQNEESTMIAYNFPDSGYLERHKAEHEHFRGLITSLLVSIEQSPNDPELLSSLAAVVFDLISQHIMVVDQMMKSFLEEYHKS